MYLITKIHFRLSLNFIKGPICHMDFQNVLSGWRGIFRVWSSGHVVRSRYRESPPLSGKSFQFPWIGPTKLGTVDSANGLRSGTVLFIGDTVHIDYTTKTLSELRPSPSFTANPILGHKLWAQKNWTKHSLLIKQQIAKYKILYGGKARHFTAISICKRKKFSKLLGFAKERY